MKKTLLFVLVCCFVLLSACTNSLSSKPSDSSAVAESSAITEVPSELVKDEVPEESKNSEEQSVSGDIVDATMNTITIQTDAGEQVRFSKTDVTV